MLVFAPGGEAGEVGQPYASQGSSLARRQNALPLLPIEAGPGQGARCGTRAPWRSACALGHVNDQAVEVQLGKALDAAG
eukprot:15447542-Alexandrium_andersonii.AAC.1